MLFKMEKRRSHWTTYLITMRFYEKLYDFSHCGSWIIRFKKKKNPGNVHELSYLYRKGTGWMKLSFLSGFNCIKSQASSLIIHLFGFEILWLFDPAEVLPFISPFPETPINFTKFLFREKNAGKGLI